jgi:hypothetical protein
MDVDTTRIRKKSILPVDADVLEKLNLHKFVEISKKNEFTSNK